MSPNNRKCQWFQKHASDLAQGNLAGSVLVHAQDHLFECDACSAFFDALVNPPAELMSQVMQRTQNDACRQAESQLAAFIDQPVQGLDADLLSAHVHHCSSCHDLLQVMIRLGETLPELALLEPPLGFTQAVLQKTSRPQRLPLLRRLKQFIERLTQRPRFALEVAYVLSMVAFMGIRFSPNLQKPIQSANATIASLSESIQSTHGQLGQTLGGFSSQAAADVSDYLAASHREVGQALRKVDFPQDPNKHPVKRLHKTLRDVRQLLEKTEDLPSMTPPSKKGDSHE